jgi:hypothetical protein
MRCGSALAGGADDLVAVHDDAEVEAERNGPFEPSRLSAVRSGEVEQSSVAGSETDEDQDGEAGAGR